ncbi:MAG: hypothetical protein VCD66_07685 [Alphaproteobacteria bacterium]
MRTVSPLYSKVTSVLGRALALFRVRAGMATRPFEVTRFFDFPDFNFLQVKMRKFAANFNLSNSLVVSPVQNVLHYSPARPTKAA